MFDLQGLNIYLIGMMGSGKSTLGNLLAQKLDYGFIDTDSKIVENSDRKSIPEIFEIDGEGKFRQIETQVLAEVATYQRHVIATGGGIVIKPENWTYLKQGLTIWLDPTIDILIDRLEKEDSNTRPLLDHLSELYIDRRDLYAKANIHIPIISSHLSVSEIIAQITTQIIS